MLEDSKEGSMGGRRPLCPPAFGNGRFGFMPGFTCGGPTRGAREDFNPALARLLPFFPAPICCNGPFLPAMGAEEDAGLLYPDESGVWDRDANGACTRD